ncbi:hypothetical protein LSAT2_018237 [Lamellibrachia satsuma]|nr:hypothetical protein LSAT2_018237 [Lamellibrachia satsuma]
MTSRSGTCDDKADGFHCICPSDAIGIYCEARKILCNDIDCKNGATCRDIDTGYICDCVAGYNGSLCETDIDECAGNPCDPDNGVSCQDRLNGYECTCHTCSCSSLSPTADCSFGRLGAMKACKDAQGAHSGETEYYLAHPNTCNKYIRCFSSGNDGVVQPCGATSLSFNPDYTGTADVCKDKNEVPQCKADLAPGVK